MGHFLKTIKMKNYILIALTIICFQSFSQGTLESANQKYGSQDWAGAVKDYKKHLKKNDSDSSAWYYLALSQKNLEEFEASLESFAKAKETNFNSTFVDLNVAKIHASSKDSDRMYTTLEESADNGFFALARLKADPEFASYQAEDRFLKVLEKVELNAYPCLRNDVWRHFDFWIGEWDVYVNGNKVGDNSITRAVGGCAIHESYTTAGSYAGQSINFYSPVDKKWHQHWVGSSGDVYNYVETKREEGLLQFVSDFMNGQGVVSLSRLTFTLRDDGTVRQLFENSTDGGETWSSGFDGIYKRKE